MIFIKRAYESVEESDGPRFLVDHLWPRGIKKETLKLTRWVKGASPSSTLCKWFNHEADKWEEFQNRYFAELDQKQASWEPLLDAAQEGDFTLVFAAADTDHNNAVALRSYLISQLKNRARQRRTQGAPLPVRGLR